MLELTKPPIMGAATRVMISEPVPLINMIGGKPAIVEQVVIIMGLTRWDAASVIYANNLSLLSSFSEDLNESIALLRKVSMTIPDSTAIPASAIKPTPTATDKL